jgi:hypothetical protein
MYPWLLQNCNALLVGVIASTIAAGVAGATKVLWRRHKRDAPAYQPPFFYSISVALHLRTERKSVPPASDKAALQRESAVAGRPTSGKRRRKVPYQAKLWPRL